MCWGRRRGKRGWRRSERRIWQLQRGRSIRGRDADAPTRPPFVETITTSCTARFDACRARTGLALDSII
eukprot:4044067-Pleurochrysis_carterae.AAC.1